MSKYITKYTYRLTKFTFMSFGIHSTYERKNLIVSLSCGYYTIYLVVVFR